MSIEVISIKSNVVLQNKMSSSVGNKIVRKAKRKENHLMSLRHRFSNPYAPSSAEYNQDISLVIVNNTNTTNYQIQYIANLLTNFFFGQKTKAARSGQEYASADAVAAGIVSELKADLQKCLDVFGLYLTKRDCLNNNKMTLTASLNEIIEYPFRDWNKQQIERYGFYIQGVASDVLPRNFHTHGIQESFGHPDLQIVAAVSTNVAETIFYNFVDIIKKGHKYTAGELMLGVLATRDGTDAYTTSIEATEGGRKVLRIIIPDDNFNLSKESMNAEAARQYQNLLTE